MYEKLEGQYLGSISQQVKELKNELNKALNRKLGQEIVHHGADDANPYAVINDNFPATFFVPENLLDRPLDAKNNTLRALFNINENNTVILETPNEFSKFQQLMIDQGFISPINEQWNKGIIEPLFTNKNKLSSHFVETIKVIQRKLSITNDDEYNIKYQKAQEKLAKGEYINNGFITESSTVKSNNINKELALLRLGYHEQNNLTHTIMRDKNNLIFKDKKQLYAQSENIKWFETEGYKILELAILDDSFNLTHFHHTKLNEIFLLLSQLPKFEGSIYNSFSINKNSDLSNIKKGNLIAFDSIFYGYGNIENLHNTITDNVYISIIGEHNAKQLVNLYADNQSSVLIAPGTHFRILEHKNINDKSYIVLEATNKIINHEPVFDLFDGKLKGIGIDCHRTTLNEKIDQKLAYSKLGNIFADWRGEHINKISIKNIIDKIITGKLSIDYTLHKYFNEISTTFATTDRALLVKMLTSQVHDPLLRRIFNEYVCKKITQEKWLEHFSINYLTDDIRDNAKRVKTLLMSINDQPISVDKLSDSSILLLSHYFDEFDLKRLEYKLLQSVSNRALYQQTLSEVDDLIILSSNKELFSEIKFSEAVALSKKIIISNAKITKDLFYLRNVFAKNNLLNKYELTLNINNGNTNNHSDYSLFILKDYITNTLNQDFNKFFNLFHFYAEGMEGKHLDIKKSEFIQSFIDGKKFIANNFMFDDVFKCIGGMNVYDAIVNAMEGTFLVSVNDHKVTINKKIEVNKNITLELFIPELGSIKISGEDNERISLELLYFLNEVYKVSFNYNDNIKDIYGEIYRLRADKISSIDLIDKFVQQSQLIIDNCIKNNKINIFGIEIDKNVLTSLGVRINNKRVDNIFFSEGKIQTSSLKFDAAKLNDYFLVATGTEDNTKIISLIKKLLNNKVKNIKNILLDNADRMDYLASVERLTKIIELNTVPLNKNYWQKLRKPSLALPRYMKIISKIGYANIGFNLWQSANSTLVMIDKLINENLSTKERKEITTNLALLISEMVFNGFSEMAEIIVAKGLFRYRYNPATYINKLTTRISVAFNLAAIGFDIYNAYDNFSRLAGENDERQYNDYVVYGSFAVISALATIGCSIATLAGITAAGPVGIAIGILITVILSSYNAARIIQESKNYLHFTPIEELNNGFYAFFMGDLIPNKKNKLTAKMTDDELNKINNENTLAYFNIIQDQDIRSHYFYTNEKIIYEEHFYYQILPNDLILALKPATYFIFSRIGINLPKTIAEQIASKSDVLSAKKTDYKYYLPKSTEPTNENLIFDLDFYINYLKRYRIDIIEDNNDLYSQDIVDANFISSMRTTELNIRKEFLEENQFDPLFNIKNQNKYFTKIFDDNSPLYFNTNNGDDIISAPLNTKNIFDIHNGTKRYSGGLNDDIFNLYATESPQYASRFYGREGNDTLRIGNSAVNMNGYIVNLSDNYVKFKDALNHSNSQNFCSKLYAYQTNTGISYQLFRDDMPGVTLQDDTVIAYLNDIENIISSDNAFHNDNLVGNEKDNYLNGGRGTDYLYGLAGKDILVLEDGFAEGGEGVDTYIISKPPSDNQYHQIAEVRIHETQEEENSLVMLGYGLANINSIIRRGKNIHLLVSQKKTDSDDGEINHTIVLINYYKDEISNQLCHLYSVITDDGFILSYNPKQDKKNNAIFTFSYSGLYHSQRSEINYFHINEDRNKIITQIANEKNFIKIIPSIKYSGLLGDDNISLSLTGNSDNNSYFSLQAGYTIQLSSGRDIYHLKTFLCTNNNAVNEIYFSIDNRLIANNSKATIYIPDISGFDLAYKAGRLFHRYNPNAHLALCFSDYELSTLLNSGFMLRIIDKDNNTFTLPMPDSPSSLLRSNLTLDLKITTTDDILIIPDSLILNKAALADYSINSLGAAFSPLSSALDYDKSGMHLLPIIELLEGNDKAINNNPICSVIDGGEGNDHLIVYTGHHILIAGKGDNILNGGSGNDLLISEFGNDYLSGGNGTNSYIIQKRKGHITVYDEGENSRIIVTGFDDNEALYSLIEDNNLHYRTADNQFAITIVGNKNKVVSPIIMIKRQPQWSADKLANIIYEMALFNEKQLSSMQGSQYTSPLNWNPEIIAVDQL